MNNVNKTLYIPLYGKAYVSRKNIILRDKKAEEIWNAEGFELKGKSKKGLKSYEKKTDDQYIGGNDAGEHSGACGLCQ